MSNFYILTTNIKTNRKLNKKKKHYYSIGYYITSQKMKFFIKDLFG